LTNQKDKVFSCSEFDEKVEVELKSKKGPFNLRNNRTTTPTKRVSELELEIAV
jgi:hypothetical protein